MKALFFTACGIWLLVLAYHAYWGMTTVPSEGDSLIYHLPIAESVVSGSMWRRDVTLPSPFAYYPGTGESLVAGMMVLGIPLNLFNVMGWVLLTASLWVLAHRFGLSTYLAGIWATSFALLPSLIRLLPAQTVDIWMTLWVVWMFLLLLQPRNTWKYFLMVGGVWGLMAGTKYSGLGYVGAALLFFGLPLWKVGGKKLMYACITAALVGGGWYVRNWMFKGNPFYPLDMWIWKGDVASQLPIVWKTLWFTPWTWGILWEAWISEFLLWGLVIAAPVVSKSKWVGLGMLYLIMYLGLPGGYGTLLSNLRYLFVGLIPLGLVVGRWLEERGKGRELAVLLIVSMTAVLPQFEYWPKLFFGVLAVMGWGLWRKQKNWDLS